MHPSPNVPEKYFLYAEDDKDDQELLTEVIARLDPTMEVVCCNHGLELMQFLEDLPAGEHLPCCVVLDLNMPIWDGLETLSRLKKHASLKDLPVVMFTTSSAERDAQRSLALGAEVFLTKPLRQEEMEAAARQFSLFCQRAPTKK